MASYLPVPGTTGFLLLCILVWLLLVTKLTAVVCRWDMRSVKARKPGISAVTLAVLSLLGGWPGYKKVQWLDAHRAGGPVAAWVATLAGLLYVGLAVWPFVPGQMPDMTPGEMLTYLIHGQSGVDDARLPTRFGPGS